TTGLAAMPFAYGFSSASADGWFCYAFGNAYSASTGNEIYQFHPALGWSTVAGKTLTSHRAHSAAAAVNGKAYVCGGFDYDALAAKADVDEWSGGTITPRASLQFGVLLGVAGAV